MKPRPASSVARAGEPATIEGMQAQRESKALESITEPIIGGRSAAYVLIVTYPHSCGQCAWPAPG